MPIRIHTLLPHPQKIPQNFGDSVVDDQVHRVVCSEAIRWANENKFLLVGINIVSSSAQGGDTKHKAQRASTWALIYYDSDKYSKGDLQYTIETYHWRSTENSIYDQLQNINNWSESDFAFLSIDNWEQLSWEPYTKKVKYKKHGEVSLRLTTKEVSTVVVFYYENKSNSWLLPIRPVTNTRVEGWKKNWIEAQCPEPIARDEMCNIRSINNDGSYVDKKNCDDAHSKMHIVVHEPKETKIQNLKNRKKYNPIGRYVFRRPLYKCYKHNPSRFYEVRVKSKTWVFASYQSCVDKACEMGTDLISHGYKIISIQLQTTMNIRSSIMIFYYGPFPSLLAFEHASKKVVAEYITGDIYTTPFPKHTAYAENMISISTDLYKNVKTTRMHITFFWLMPNLSNKTPIYFKECDQENDVSSTSLLSIGQGHSPKYMSGITMDCINDDDLVILPSGHPESVSALKMWLSSNNNRNPYTNEILSETFIERVFEDL